MTLVSTVPDVEVVLLTAEPTVVIAPPPILLVNPAGSLGSIPVLPTNEIVLVFNPFGADIFGS